MLQNKSISCSFGLQGTELGHIFEKQVPAHLRPQTQPTDDDRNRITQVLLKLGLSK